MRIYVGGSETPLMGVTRLNDISIHLEKHKWDFVDNIADADIIPVCRAPIVSGESTKIYTLDDQLQLIKPYLYDKWFLMLMDSHISETCVDATFTKFIDEYPTDRMFICSSISSSSMQKHIHFDVYFNLVKAYFTQYSSFDLLGGRLWTGPCNKSSFAIPDIEPYLHPSKKFLIPNNIRPAGHSDRSEFKSCARIELAKHINPAESYYSDFRRGRYLLPEQKELYSTYSDLGVGITPIANSYYLDSMISVYVETLVGTYKATDKVNSITEKTYIPLVKGHFIMPLSYPGIIQDLKDQGFLFPDWIDYKYDLVDNHGQRLNQFLCSFEQLKKTPIELIKKMANNDINIRKHNRNLFFKKKYDSLYDKVEQRIMSR